MSILKLIDKYPELKSIELTDININVFKSLSKEISDYEILKYCFAINFYSGKYNNISCFDKDLKLVLDLQDILNNKKIISPNQTSIDIYLSYLKCLFDEKIKISKSESDYALELLKDSANEDLKSSLSDLLFKVSDPGEYNKTKNSLVLDDTDIFKYFKAQNRLQNSIKKILSKCSFPYEISSRIKTVYSLNKKIHHKNLSPKQIHDLLGVRIYLQDSAQCFEVMQIMIKEFKVLGDRLKDYISYPKENGYQSLHLTIDYDSIPIEIQIRTYEMHEICEKGSASHREYKKAIMT